MNHPRKLFLNYRNNLLMLYKNLPKNEGRRILIIRRLLDTIALARYIAGGEWQHARAVWLAHIHLSVFENKNGILRVKHHGFGIILVHQNPLIVKVFVPRIAAG